MHLACCESQWRRARSTASGRSLSGSSNGCEGLTCPRTLLVRHIHLGSAFACHQTHRLYFGSTRPRRYYIRAHCIGGGSVDIEHSAQLSISRTCRPSDPPHRLSLDWWSFSLPAKSSCIPRKRPGSLGFSRHFSPPLTFCLWATHHCAGGEHTRWGLARDAGGLALARRKPWKRRVYLRCTVQRRARFEDQPSNERGHIDRGSFQGMWPCKPPVCCNRYHVVAVIQKESRQNLGVRLSKLFRV